MAGHYKTSYLPHLGRRVTCHPGESHWEKQVKHAGLQSMPVKADFASMKSEQGHMMELNGCGLGNTLFSWRCVWGRGPGG